MAFDRKKSGGKPQQSNRGGKPAARFGGSGGKGAPKKGGQSAGGKKQFKPQRPKQQGGKPAAASAASAAPKLPKSARTKDIDIHQASKVAAEIARGINQFKDKLQRFSFDELDEALAFVPPSFIAQHLPPEVASYRTYLPRFAKGSSSPAVAFIKWYEWASFEANKGTTFHNDKKQHHGGGAGGDANGAADGDDDEDGAAAAAGAADADGGADGGKRPRKMSQSRSALAQTAKEREHARALLQMCVRHNSSRRREGHHALINHLVGLLTDVAECRTPEQLREAAHHTVPYILTRLLLGMATDNAAGVLLNCQALHLVLQQTGLTPRVVIGLVDEELSIGVRMKAMEARVKRQHNAEATAADADDDDDDALDPDAINDPTKGERNQRIAAALFALSAVITCSTKRLSADDAARIAQMLCFCYVESKGLRVLSGNMLLALARKVKPGAIFDNPAAWQWIQFAFFRFPKLDYFRPEAVQVALLLMEAVGDATPGAWKPALLAGNASLHALCQRDALEPSTVEHMAAALFRNEQVTLVHPMVHPVWADLLALVRRRCARGESLKQHVTTIVHTMIAPYRRGAGDSPRRALFQKVVDMIGRLALQDDDESERLAMVQVASRAVGFGRRGVVKPTDPAELRKLPADAMDAKVRSLVRQLHAITDADPSAQATRTWTLRELRACLLVRYRDDALFGLPAPSYVDAAALALLKFGFFRGATTKDDLNQNRAIFLFADIFSFTYAKPGAPNRPRTTLTPSQVMLLYIEQEEQKGTRFATAVGNSKFRKARNRIVGALDDPSRRSVLFYDARDAHILLTLLFLVLSVDDPTNEAALHIATSVVPDLVRFYLEGTIETVEVLYDALMALVMRPTAPLHVMPLMACVRRVAMGFLFKFARYIRSRAALDLVLAPLVEAYRVDERAEAAAAAPAPEDEAEDGASSAAAGGDEEDGEEEEEGEEEEDEEGEDEAAAAAELGSADDDDATSVATEPDSDASDLSSSGGDDDDDEDDASSSSSESEAANNNNDDDDDEWAGVDGENGFEEEEAPTQHYLQSLQSMVGDIDLGFAYPTDVEAKQKSDAVRAIHIAVRVGLAMRAPEVVHVLQVLLAVLRGNVKGGDEVVFEAAKVGVETLMMSPMRYFGRFVPPTELFALLEGIQSYCRKLEHHVAVRQRAGADGSGDAATSARELSQIRRRLAVLKKLALSVIHYVAFLAHKNHAGEDVRITIAEFYGSIFYDRGWDAKRALPQLKRDIYHYRHGFAWACLPAAVDKFEQLRAVDGAARVRAFVGACAMVEAMLPRLSGLPAPLKASAAASIRRFLQLPTLSEIFEMKHPLLHTYFHCLKFALEYNAKVQLDTEWAAARVDEVIDDDALQVSKATIRLIGAVERLLQKPPRALAIKAATPVQLLYRQFAPRFQKAKSDFYKKARATRRTVVKALLAHRNDDPTDQERAAKRRRRDELRETDREQRRELREQRTKTLTKEEKDERRKKMAIAKQERIAKNRERKQRLHEQRTRSFQRWRSEKLAEAADE